MDLRKLPVFSMMARRMSWLAERQQVLAQNIANADTPNYRPRDLPQPSFRDMARARVAPGLAPATTDAAHISLARGRAAPEPRARPQEETMETTPSGNAVVLEEQLMKAARTAMDYEATTNLYRKHVSMIKDAIGGNR